MKKLAIFLCLGLLIADFAKTAAGQTLSILPSTLPAGTAGTPYSEQLTPSGGSGTGYQFSIIAGASNLTNLGLSLSNAGLISGTPIAGTAAFTVELTDSVSDTATQAYTLSVNQTAVLHSFPGVTEGDSSSPDGIQPNSLIQAQDGNFYGTTALGGNAGSGTVFRLNSDGSDTIIYSFSGGADGGSPTGLLQGPNGNLYGTTSFGGASITANSACTNNDFNDPKNGDSAPCCVDSTGTNNIGCGTLFTISPSQPPSPGKILTLVNFDGATMGAFPNPLTIGLATDGVTPLFYGSSQPCSYCVTNGSLFSFNPASSNFEALSFGASGLAYPNALLQGECTNGENCDYNLYGTTQLGGGTCPSNEFNDDDLGCGGVFKYNTQTQTDTLLCELGSDNSNNQTADFTVRPDTTVIRQSGGRFPSGLEWSYTSVSLYLTEASDGSIIGTTPWACFPSSGGNFVGPDCGIDTNDAATVFQCQPPFAGADSGTANTIYQFSGDSVQDGNVSGATDGGGSLAGLMLASDGNFYGSSGFGIFDITEPEMASFLTSTASLPPPQLANLNPIALLDSTAGSNWMIQGSDGNFYGTSTTGGANGAGEVFEVSLANPLPSPVQLSFPNSQITLGSSATLTWSVPNAFSLTSQQCYPLVPNNQTGAGTWSGAGQGSVTDGVFSNSASITPTKAGTYNYAVTCGGIISGFTTLQVNLVAQTITFANPGTQTVGTPLTLSATASSGLAVTFLSATTSVCTVHLTTATFIAEGTCEIHAHQAGNSDYAAAPLVSHSFTVNGEAQTITFANPGTQTVGTPLTLSATASSGLAVTFLSATTSVCTVHLTTATFIAEGTCQINAHQAGNSDYAAAPLVSHSFTVNGEAQTITFANPGTQTVGKPLTLSAKASSGLAVAFTPITTSVCTVSGTTATFIASGTCTIDANQAGDSAYAAAPLVEQSFTVNGEAQTITFANPGKQTVGTPLTLSATASSGLAVTFLSATTSVCTVTGTTAKFIAEGTCQVNAHQAGNNIYAAAPLVSQSFTVNGEAQTITFANPGMQTVGTPLTLSATASSGLAVTFLSATTSVCTVSGTTAKFIATGTCQINAHQAGNNIYAAATYVSQSFTVNVGAQTISFANPGTQTVGKPLTLSAKASSGLAVALTPTTTTICTVSGNTATFIASGKCTIDANQAGNSNYAAAPLVEQSFTVNGEAQTITFANPGTQTVGTPLTLSATASSGLAVTFLSATTNVCTVSGTTAKFIAAGNCQINAHQAGNSTYAAATLVSQSFTVVAD